MTEYRVLLPPAVLTQAEQFLTDRGAYGVEGTGLIACTKHADGNWLADRFIAPDQCAHRGDLGCRVEVTDSGKSALAASLGPDERYLVRVHSHPGEAFHSATDDTNPALTFLGALSIVVPYYGLGLRQGLAACAVFRLTDQGWRQVDDGGDPWIRAGSTWGATW